ncbi:hypothetical protein FRC09_016885, partial [Ceratobasidium sp. 395]
SIVIADTFTFADTYLNPDANIYPHDLLPEYPDKSVRSSDFEFDTQCDTNKLGGAASGKRSRVPEVSTEWWSPSSPSRNHWARGSALERSRALHQNPVGVLVRLQIRPRTTTIFRAG